MCIRDRVREDFFTSVHVDEYILEVRETKRGMEELTSDIPNVSEEATKDLDERDVYKRQVSNLLLQLLLLLVLLLVALLLQKKKRLLSM